MRKNKLITIKIVGFMTAISFTLFGCGGGGSSSVASTPVVSDSQGSGAGGTNTGGTNVSAAADTEVTCNGACITVSADADTSSD